MNGTRLISSWLTVP